MAGPPWSGWKRAGHACLCAANRKDKPQKAKCGVGISKKAPPRGICGQDVPCGGWQTMPTSPSLPWRTRVPSCARRRDVRWLPAATRAPKGPATWNAHCSQVAGSFAAPSRFLRAACIKLDGLRPPKCSAWPKQCASYVKRHAYNVLSDVFAFCWIVTTMGEV